MKEHKGMRPHDVVILLEIINLEDQAWHNKDLAHRLLISTSEVSESLNRSKIAGLVNGTKTKVNKLAFLDFLEKGLPYVYPASPGPITRGIPTAHSAPPLNEKITQDIALVWPDAMGTIRGQAITPLHKNVPRAAAMDSELHKLLAMVDALRVGDAREKQLGLSMLREKFNYAN